MKGTNNNFIETQLCQAIGDGPFGLTDELIDCLAQHVCLTFLKTRRVVPQVLSWPEGDASRTYTGVCTEQPHRPGDYRYVADFLDALAEGRFSEDGNPANARLRTIRDQLGIPLLMAGHVAEKLRIDHKRIVEQLASNPSLYDWWCDVADECERVIGAMPMSELLFRHSMRARETLQREARQAASRKTPEPPIRQAPESRRPGVAAYRMQENRINGLCRHVWAQFKDQSLDPKTGAALRQTLEEVRQEHGPKVARSVVVRLRAQYDPTSQWCSRELWKQVFDAHIPLDTGTQ